MFLMSADHVRTCFKAVSRDAASQRQYLIQQFWDASPRERVTEINLSDDYFYLKVKREREREKKREREERERDRRERERER